jgi:hypothetical protein
LPRRALSVPAPLWEPPASPLLGVSPGTLPRLGTSPITSPRFLEPQAQCWPCLACSENSYVACTSNPTPAGTQASFRPWPPSCFLCHLPKPGEAQGRWQPGLPVQLLLGLLDGQNSLLKCSQPLSLSPAPRTWAFAAWMPRGTRDTGGEGEARVSWDVWNPQGQIPHRGRHG